MSERPEYTPAEMRKFVARYQDMEPTKRDYTGTDHGVPVEAYETLAAKSIYLLMAPEDRSRGMTAPAVVGPPGVEVSISECPPGNGAQLHIHKRSSETFMCLKGRFDVIWGDNGENSLTLEPFDLIAIPSGIFRSFKNVSDETSLLLAIIQGKGQDVMGDIAYHPALEPRIEEGFGTDVRDNLKTIGITFERT